MDAEGGLFLEEDFVRALGKELGEGREAFVDEDEITFVIIHEGTHRLIGVVVINEEARDHEVDFGEVELFVSAHQGGCVGDLVFGKLFQAEGDRDWRKIVDPDVGGVTTEDEGFRSDSGTKNEDAFLAEEVDVLRQPLGEDTCRLPATVIIDGNARAHVGHDVIFDAWVVEVHEGEGFCSDFGGVEKVRHIR